MKSFLAVWIAVLVSLHPWIQIQAQTPPGNIQSVKVKDFRGTNQRIALLGLSTEFVDSEMEEKVLEQMRRAINRYSRSYGGASIAAFNLGPNTGKKFFRPLQSDQKMDEFQKKFLQSACKDNSIEIVVLGGLREEGEDFAAELQLYDSRTDALSRIESLKFRTKNMSGQIELLAYRLMNYLDREGFVGASPQDFLEMPPIVTSALSSSTASRPSGAGGLAPGEKDPFSMNPTDLGAGRLAGRTVVAGESTPFWETWWFWTIIGGSLVTAGALTTYFLVIDQPKTGANIEFRLP